jgi:signal transduction histidine kinase
LVIQENGKINLKATLLEKYLKIEVVDSGIGISEKELPHLFDRFYRIEKSRHTSAKNLGLGLSMVKSMVELHKGTIEIKSTIHIGTTVIVLFPHYILNSSKISRGINKTKKL